MAETDPGGSGGNNWEREIIAKLAHAALDEQRRARHWGIFFKTLDVHLSFRSDVRRVRLARRT